MNKNTLDQSWCRTLWDKFWLISILKHTLLLRFKGYIDTKLLK